MSECPNTITIEGQTYQKVVSTPETAPYEIGKCYLIRTVTHYILGRLVFVGPQELQMEKACWVADTGRFSECLEDGTLAEIEMLPMPPIIGRGSVVDAHEWLHDLPTVSK